MYSWQEIEKRMSAIIFKRKLRNIVFIILVIVFVLSCAGTTAYTVLYVQQRQSTRDVQNKLQELREASAVGQEEMEEITTDEAAKAASSVIYPAVKETISCFKLPAEILSEYKKLYETNQDMVGWLFIDGTQIDYPVMQTVENESRYLSLDFYGQYDKNGCLVLDADSVAGTGTAAKNYTDGTAPTTNLIIHGHTMKSGEMFGRLRLYAQEDYGKEHSLICFDTIYEKREYELIAAFYSQVYYSSQEVFKYYNFFQADTQEEFDDWYSNIKQLSLYDTGVTAEFGDEFITLSCCSYHVEDGRFVVVGRRKRD